MIKRNDPALGYTEHADAILLEPRMTVQPSQPGNSLVRCLPPRQKLLIHDRVRNAPRAKTVNEQCGNAGTSQFFRAPACQGRQTDLFPLRHHTAAGL